MYNVGIALLVIGALIVFGSDGFFKNGKIKDTKTLLLIKVVGFSITVVGMILMIKMK